VEIVLSLRNRVGAVSSRGQTTTIWCPPGAYEIDRRQPQLFVRASRRNAKGTVLAVDVAVRGWPAIAGVVVLAAAVVACMLARVIR
jgi:hypothetical protein